MVQVQQFADVHVAQFEGEGEVVLFVAGSSDVLLCSALAWQQVLGNCAGYGKTIDEPQGQLEEQASAAEVLAATLTKLSAEIR